MIREVSEVVLADYLEGLERVYGRIETGEDHRDTTLSGLLERATLNLLTRDRDRSLAWCELMLHGGRSEEGRTIAERWFSEIDRVWGDIGHALGESPDATMIAADLAVGYLFLLHPLHLPGSDLQQLISGEKMVFDNPLATLPVKVPDVEMPEPGAAKILEAAVEQLVNEGAQSVTYAGVSERAGLSRSAPSYYYDSVGAMLEAAQFALFRRAKDRYRAGFRALDGRVLKVDRMADLTAAIFTSEALQHADENLAFYSVWVRASARAKLRPVILAALNDLQHAWVRSMEGVGVSRRCALKMHALFVGKLVRALAAGVDIRRMALAREHFHMVMTE
jgi:DNA-binding transcriptional regulator YbjK